MRCAAGRGTTITTTLARPTATTITRTTATTTTVFGWCAWSHILTWLPFSIGLPDLEPASGGVALHNNAASSLCPPTTVCGTRPRRGMRWRRVGPSAHVLGATVEQHPCQAKTKAGVRSGFAPAAPALPPTFRLPQPTTQQTPNLHHHPAHMLILPPRQPPPLMHQP